MAAVITASAAAAAAEPSPRSVATDVTLPPGLGPALFEWSVHAGLSAFSPDVLRLGLLAWTRLHGIISLELGGHLAATGLDPSVLHDAEVVALGCAAGAASAAPAR